MKPKMTIHKQAQIARRGNVDFGFPDMSKWERLHPGKIEFCCEFCGLYHASKPRCNKCESAMWQRMVELNIHTR